MNPLTLDLEFEDGTRDHFTSPLPITIGRGSDAALRIRAWRVGRRHATLDQRAAGIFIDDHGALAGTWVNGQRVAQYGPLHPDDEIIVGPCRIRIRNSGQGPLGALPRNATASGPDHPDPDNDENANGHVILNVLRPWTGAAPTCEAQDILFRDGGDFGVSGDDASCGGMARAERARHRQRLHAALLEALDLHRRDVASMSDAALRAEAATVLAELLRQDAELPATLDRDALLDEIVDEAVGLGPLEPLLADDRITEIMVNRHDEIFVEVGGQLHRYPGGFSSEQSVMSAIERIVAPLGRRIDESAPMVDARLSDGSRVNAVIPPIALRGAAITIRKFPRKRPAMQDLLRAGALDAHMGRFLQACVMQRKNIIVSGGTGSGKTTLLNVLSDCIPAGERIVTIEDAAELQLAHEHLVVLEARPANLEGRGAIPIRDLVRNALRMRPDRIVVGECRGAEAFDMLAAMNTGHEGSLTTLHANTPRDALARLETMILMAGMDLPLGAVRDQVASSIDFIVQQARLSSGHRVITAIVQVLGQESGRIQLQDLFRYDAGPPPAYAGCGILPENMQLDDGSLSIDLFNQRVEIGQGRAGWQSLH